MNIESPESPGRERGMRIVTITISTSKSAGEGNDEGTPALAAFVGSLGARLVTSELIPDHQELIADRLRHWADSGEVDAIFTSGGTGLAMSDVTPEATTSVIDRAAPGIAEAMRLASKPHTKYWMMSRGVAGLRGSTLIVNFPGNPRAIAEAGEPLLDTLEHAMALLLIEGGGH
ncbi:MAG: MogA/MoaB family molybdenum cofactor biosynthesis protein [Thermoleophilaceae bacterium]|nr:MogA/MoaB family molybdenum cofactor biosynthesis protein [Thermoleophilaceae bacterium]